MNVHNRALSDLTVIDGEVCCLDGQSFDLVAYSHFKYGWLPAATSYADGLAAIVAEQIWEESGDRPIYIVSAPYKFIPTASHAIARRLLRNLTIQAIELGIEPPVLLPMHKARVGGSSYAQSSEADRLKSLSTLGLHVDESLIAGSTVLVVDDIRITGSAERATATYLEPLAPATVWYLHAARLAEHVARANPGLEDVFNQTVEHSPQVILQQVKDQVFELNTRVLRLILEWSFDVLVDFVESVPIALLEQVYGAALGSGLTYTHRHLTSIKLVGDECINRQARVSSHRSLNHC